MYALSQSNTHLRGRQDDEVVYPPQVPVRTNPPDTAQVNEVSAKEEHQEHGHHHHSHGHKKSKKEKKHHHRHHSHGHHTGSEPKQRKVDESKRPPGIQDDPFTSVKVSSCDRDTVAASTTTARSGKQQLPGRSSYEEKHFDIEDFDEKEEEYATSGKTYRADERATMSEPGVVAVSGTAAALRMDEDEENQLYYSNENTNDQDSALNYSMQARHNEEPIEAMRVSDNEVTHDQAQEIAKMVQRNLMTTATVPLQVQPSDEFWQRKKRSCLILVGLLVLVITGIAVGVGLGISKNKEPEPAASPISTRAEAFRGLLRPVSGEQLMNESSPQFQALQWIADIDPANMTVGVDSNDKFATRYVAAVLYYAFRGDGWRKKYNFLSKKDVCEWSQKSVDVKQPYGIGCDSNGMIDSLRLLENNLIGSIPHEIGFLSNLTEIDMTNNTVHGTLSGLENLSHLERLDFTANVLTGPLPEFLLTHPKLSTLVLDNNGLTGTISSSLGTFPNLQILWLRDNKLTGELPSSMGQSTALESVDLDSNQLVGTIPDFSSATSIIHFLGSNNQLSGKVPTSVGNMTKLVLLFLDANNLTGYVPTELGKCQRLLHINFAGNELRGDISTVIDSLPPSLESFDVDRNLLQGTIPTSIGSLTKLDFLDFQDNKMDGVLPTELGLLTALEDLNCAFNEFSGTVPMEMLNLAKLTDLRLQGNNFIGSLDAFCSINLDFFAANTCKDPDRIQCTCCSHCCDRDADYCDFV